MTEYIQGRRSKTKQQYVILNQARPATTPRITTPPATSRPSRSWQVLRPDHQHGVGAAADRRLPVAAATGRRDGERRRAGRAAAGPRVLAARPTAAASPAR